MNDVIRARVKIEPRYVIRYLHHKGWKIETLSQVTRVYMDDEGLDPVEIFFSNGASEPYKSKEVYFALLTVSEFYERPIEYFIVDIQSIQYDLITGRIPDQYVSNETIEFRIASQYVLGMKNFLTSSAHTEITSDTYFQRTKKDAIIYADKCRFGHTFRGSFGFVVESPVGWNDQPTIEGIAEDWPFGRRVIQRIERGLMAYSDAVIEQDVGLITKSTGGFSANMCDALADIVEETAVSSLSLGFRLSPEWSDTSASSNPHVFNVNVKDIDILRNAAQSMRSTETPRNVRVFGRIKRLETDGNPADLLEDVSAREIEVSWVNEENRLLQIRMLLSPRDYLTAVEAHKKGSPVSANGLLIRKGRSWRLDNVENFGVI